MAIVDIYMTRSGAWDCEVSASERSCAACRFKKCQDVGMREDYLVVCNLYFVFGIFYSILLYAML